MPCFDTNHKQQSANCLQPVDDTVAREIEPRSPPHEGDAGEMHSNQNARQASFQTSEQGGWMQCVPAKYCRGKSGLSRVELALLAYVIEHPEPWQQGPRKEIADDCGCAANSIPRAARTLVRLQLIETVPGGGSVNTIYSLGRNMQVTESADARNAHVSRNLEDTTSVTSELRAPSSAEQTETNTTDGVVTTLRGGRNIPPPHPPITTSSVEEGNPETTEPSFERGLGSGLFGEEQPAAKKSRGTKRRPKREKFYATEESMPTEPNAEMAAYAAAKKLVNGTRAEQFGKFCRYHIRKRTLIASLEQRWETWVDNWAKDNPPNASGAPKGLIKRTKPDGSVYYDRDHRQNGYR